MSLFDSLKYPITNISNNDEMNALPIAIIYSLIKDMETKLGYETDDLLDIWTIDGIPDRAGSRILGIINGYCDDHTPRDGDFEFYKLRDEIAAWAKNRLKEIIRDYEPV